MRGARWVTAGLADQVVSATANAANTILALVLLDRGRAGLMLLSLGLAYLAIGINRAFVGEVILALAPRYDRAGRSGLVRHGLGTALTLGSTVAVLFAAVWAVWPKRGDVDLRDLIWVAPFLPMILLHDTGRYSYLAMREPARALLIDLVWVGVQGAAVVVMHLTGLTSAGGLFVCWGLGATAGAAVYLLRTGVWPGGADPRRWFTQTRHLSGWFTATAVVAQVQVQVVGFVVAAQLSNRELSGLRGAQTVLIQPVQNFVTAMMGLLVPRASRLAGEVVKLPAGRREAPAAQLRQQTRVLVAVMAGLALLLIAVLVPVAHTLLPRVPKFADLAPLALPMSIQAGIYLIQLPITAAMRGMHRARTLFGQYLIFSTISVVGLVAGAELDRLPGAAWGLTIGAAVGLLVMIALYRRARRRLGEADAGRFAAAGEPAATAP